MMVEVASPSDTMEELEVSTTESSALACGSELVIESVTKAD